MALKPLKPMDRQEFLDLCAAYALGALEGDELLRFRATAAQGDAEMRAAVADALKTAANLSLAAPAATPSDAVRQRLRQQVRARLHHPAPARPFRFHEEPKTSFIERLLGGGMPSRLGFTSAFSLLVVAVALVTYSLSLRDKLTAQQVALLDTHQRMDALADSTRSRITALRDSLSQKEAMLEVLSARKMQMVALNGMEDSMQYGKIMWDPERKTAVLQVSLPPAPDSMSYQLWVIRDKKPMDAGVFQVKAASAEGGMYRIEQLVETDKKHISAFAVTMEPKGGMPQPTGKMYLMGPI